MYPLLNRYVESLSKKTNYEIYGDLIAKEELVDFCCNLEDESCSLEEYPWLCNTSYWTKSSSQYQYIYSVYSDGKMRANYYATSAMLGLRPVIVVKLKK